ncbi:MarR family winged helix-turn-helix transcriptional regulator [Elioraea rosea]|uniref:MarR family winged helix-turn-helix transcriptional regulator n=1 Tax=Elioraea rosea TaxID=2492390 RepID=UPI0019507D69|nr:MarR family transcriptional regulator [Elioraea rosea]
MTQDVIRSLGYLCLGTRLKRLGEALQADVQRVLDELDPPVQASHHPLLAALDRLGPLAVGELAQAVGLSQPGITRSIAQLAALGLVEQAQPNDDQRRRIISLTTSGRGLVQSARRNAWPRIERAVAALCEGLSGPLLEQLSAIEDGLAAAPMHRRAAGGKEPVR